MGLEKASSTEKYLLCLWVMDGQLPDRLYLQALIRGDLHLANYYFAQEMTGGNLVGWVESTLEFLEEELPRECWGTDEKVTAWEGTKGFRWLGDEEKIIARLSGRFDKWIDMRNKFGPNFDIEKTFPNRKSIR